MNFRELQLLEYGIKCIEEIINSSRNNDQTVSLNLVIQSSDDIFTASSLPEKISSNYQIFNFRDDMPFLANPAYLISSFQDDDNSFMKVRHEAYKARKFFSLSDTFLTTQPFLIVPQLIELIKDIDPSSEGHPIWFNYKSLITGLEFNFNYNTEDDYKIISLDYSDSLVK